jgi:hypothetical protein
MTPQMAASTTSSTRTPQAGRPPRCTRTELVRQSVLGILAEHGVTVGQSTVESEAV